MELILTATVIAAVAVSHFAYPASVPAEEEYTDLR